MPYSVDIEADNLLIMMGKIMEAGSNPEPHLDAMGADMAERVRLGFAQSSDPYGRPWKPVKRGGQPLRNTGAMLNGINYATGNNYVEVGSDFKYARVHQYGAVIKPVRAKRLVFTVGGQTVFARQVTIPARPFLPLDGLPDDWEQSLMDTLEASLRREVGID